MRNGQETHANGHASRIEPVGAGSILYRHWFPPHVLRTILSSLIDVYTMRSGFHRAFTLTLAQETGQLAQSLGTRLLVKVLSAVGAIFNPFFTLALLFTVK